MSDKMDKLYTVQLKFIDVYYLQLAKGNCSDRKRTPHLPPPLTQHRHHEPGEAAAAAGASAHRRQGYREEEEEGN